MKDGFRVTGCCLLGWLCFLAAVHCHARSTALQRMAPAALPLELPWVQYELMVIAVEPC